MIGLCHHVDWRFILGRMFRPGKGLTLSNETSSRHSPQVIDQLSTVWNNEEKAGINGNFIVPFVSTPNQLFKQSLKLQLQTPFFSFNNIINGLTQVMSSRQSIVSIIAGWEMFYLYQSFTSRNCLCSSCQNFRYHCIYSHRMISNEFLRIWCLQLCLFDECPLGMRWFHTLCRGVGRNQLGRYFLLLYQLILDI